MVPSGEVTERVLDDLYEALSPCDIVIDEGNSNYKESMRRADCFKEKLIYFFDVGTSGGMDGARNGACTMIGGDLEAFGKIEQLFQDVSTDNGYLYVGPSGSGHFLKMVHNGIEYGMMQAIAEKFEVFEKSPFDFSKICGHSSSVPRMRRYSRRSKRFPTRPQTHQNAAGCRESILLHATSCRPLPCTVQK